MAAVEAATNIKISDMRGLVILARVIDAQVAFENAEIQLAPTSPTTGVTNISNAKIPLAQHAEAPVTVNKDDANSVSDPVNPANGDFYIERTDLAFPAKGLDINLSRAYHSHSSYDGPLGQGWAHNFDQRLVPGTDDCTNEMRFHAGLGSVFTFEIVSVTTSGVSYRSTGIPTRMRLSGARNGFVNPLTWQVQEPSGTTRFFDYRGLLTRIQTASGFGLDVTWESAPGEAAYRVASVKDVSHRTITFHYYTDSGRLADVTDSATDLAVHYNYNHWGELVDVLDASGRREYYGYKYTEGMDSTPGSTVPYPVEQPGDEKRIPEGYLQASCELVCSASNKTCRSAGVCDNPQVIGREQCEKVKDDCGQQCQYECREYTGSVGPGTADPDLIASCLNGDDGCYSRCHDYCRDMRDRWEEPCIAAYGPGTINENLYWGPIHDFCFRQCHFGRLDNSENDCDLTCAESFMRTCPVTLEETCPTTCPGQCLNECRATAWNQCTYECRFGRGHDTSNSCVEAQDRCNVLDWAGICETGCVQGCVSEGRKEGVTFGHLSDLAHNIVHVYDGDHRLFVANTYGEDPRAPSFDAVVTQVTGDYSTQFDYRDLNAEHDHAIDAPTTGPAALADSLDTFESVDLCPTWCMLPGFFPGVVEYVPWAGQLILVKGGSKAGGLDNVTGSPAALLPTVFAYESIGGRTRARALVGDASLPADLTFSFRTDGGALTFRRDPAMAGHFEVVGSAAALNSFKTLAEITVLSDQAGALRVYAGRPLGLANVTNGTCSVPFQATRNQANQIDLLPTGACSAELTLSPLATVLDGPGYASDYMTNGSDAFAGVDLFAASVMVPGRHTITLHRVADVSGRYEQGIGARDGTSPNALAKAALDAVNAPIFHAPAAGATSIPILTAFHVPAKLRAPGEFAFVLDTSLEFHPEPFTPSSCVAEFVGDPVRGTVRGPKPAHATVVTDAYGAKLAFYYDKDGRSIRQQNLAPDPTVRSIRSVNYNSAGDVTGVEGPVRERVCLSYDNLGNLSDVRQYPAPNSMGAVEPIHSRAEWRQSSPTRLTKVYDPRDLAKVAVSYQWDGLGRLIGATDGLSQHTTYVPEPWGGAHQITGPDGSITEIVSDADTGAPEQTVVDAATHGARITNVTELDPAGRPLLSQAALGSSVAYAWSGPRLGSATFEATGVSARSDFTYNGSGQVTTVNNGRSLVTTTYDVMGSVEHVTIHALDGSAPDSTRCRKTGPDGRVLEVVQPEGERERYTYDAAGRVTSVYHGKWARDSLGSWDDACVEALPRPGELAAGETSHFWYDPSGHLLAMRTATGAVTHYTYDGFGRLIEEMDGRGTRRRIGYDAVGLPKWTATYANVSGVPAYAPPYAGDHGLLKAADFIYDDKGRVTSVAQWHLDQNGTAIGDGRSIVSWTYDDVHRTVRIVDDAWQATTSTYDAAGRLARIDYSTGGFETYSYTDNGRTVTKEWTSPAPSGTQKQRTVLTEWGAPSNSSQITPDGVVVPLASWTYDQVGRPHTLTSTGGAVQTISPDAFDRTHTTQTSQGLGSTETVTVDYDRDGRVVNRRSWAANPASPALTSYVYDAFDRVTQVERPGHVLESFAYNGVSPLPWHHTDAKGAFSTMAYTLADQLESIDVAASPTAPMSTWARRSFAYDPLGRLTQARDSGAQYLADTDDIVAAMAWDSLGNRTLESSSVFGSSTKITHTYDGRGLPIQSQLGTLAVTRGYDAIGREQDIWLGTSTQPEAHFAYAGLGAATTRRLSTGVVTNYGFNTLGRLIQIDDKQGSTPLAAWSYRVPADGSPRVATFTRANTGPISSVFQVDNAGRLIAEDHGVNTGNLPMSSAAPTIAANEAVAPFMRLGRGVGNGGFGGGVVGTAWRTYTLDGRSNWRQRDAGLAGLVATTATNLLDAYTSFGAQVPTYNVDGSLASVGSEETYTYNLWGDVRTVRVGNTTKQYAYDALGRRVTETTAAGANPPSAATRYLYDGARRVLRWLPGQGAPEVSVDGQGLDEHIVRVAADGGRTYYHQGRDHSVYMLSSPTGSPSEWYQYTAYGEMTILSAAGNPITGSGVGNRFGYQGQAFDLTTGLVDMRARFYRPQWGRFVGPDPTGLLGGPNLYAFVSARPLTGWDPLGLKDHNAYGPHYAGDGAGVDDLMPGSYCDDNDCSENTAVGQVANVVTKGIGATGAVMNGTAEVITYLPRQAVATAGDGMMYLEDHTCGGPNCFLFALQSDPYPYDDAAGYVWSGLRLGMQSFRADRVITPLLEERAAARASLRLCTTCELEQARGLGTGGRDLSLAGAGNAERTALTRQLHLRELGTDPARGGRFSAVEAAVGDRLEQQLGRELSRDTSGAFDWVGTNGKTYDAVGPAPTQFFEATSFNGSIANHLTKQGLDFVVVDLTGLTPHQAAAVDGYLGALSPAELARILVMR